ncbi:MAG: hypothetical protein MH825_08135 [Cyanobacteria bacterium]|nr:hypothetical protein [Cyanobacteriota bacterium]
MNTYTAIKSTCQALGVKIVPHYPLLIKEQTHRFKPRHYRVDFGLFNPPYHDLFVEIKSFPTINDEFILKLEMMDSYDPGLLDNYVIALANSRRVVYRRGKATTLGDLAQKKTGCPIVDLEQLPWWLAAYYA